MKATGIVRRIDDLGRIVIPKEIRRTMRIRESDPLEIFTSSDGEVIFKKYSPIGEMGSFAAAYCEILAKALEQPIAVADRDTVLAVAGAPKKDLLERRLSPVMETVMENRSLWRCGNAAAPFLNEGSRHLCSAAAPIVADGDVIGCVALLKAEPVLTELETQLLKISAAMLGKQIET